MSFPISHRWRIDSADDLTKAEVAAGVLDRAAGVLRCNKQIVVEQVGSELRIRRKFGPVGKNPNYLNVADRGVFRIVPSEPRPMLELAIAWRWIPLGYAVALAAASWMFAQNMRQGLLIGGIAWVFFVTMYHIGKVQQVGAWLRDHRDEFTASSR
jgi:hypothetical protein